MLKKSLNKAIHIKNSIFILLLFMCLSQLLSANSAKKNTFLMLAHTWNEEIDINNWWMNEKLDGVRGYWTGKQLISRAGNTFNTPKWFTQNFPSFPLDVELWIGRNQFSELISIIKTKKTDNEWKKIRYVIFDAPQVTEGFEKNDWHLHKTGSNTIPIHMSNSSNKKFAKIKFTF